MIAQWSDGVVDGPTAVDWLDARAAESPGAPFLTAGGVTHGFGAFRALVGQVAGLLVEHGVGRGDRVVLYLDRKIAHVAGYLAVASLGAIAVHVYPERPRSYVDFAAGRVGARHVLTLDGWASDAYQTVVYPAEPSRYAVVPTRPPHPVAYLMFTSGTTSTPKAVVTTWANVQAVTANLIRIADIRRGDRELIFMPLGSTGGAGHLHILLALGNHGRLLDWFLADVGDIELAELCDVIEADEIDGFLATPAIITRLLSSHRARWAEAGRRLRYLLANVTPMRQAVIVDLLTTLPDLRFVTYYGLTEASRSVINVCRASPGAEHATGRASAGVEVSLRGVDRETGVGEVVLRGPNVCPGYWEDGPDDRRVTEGFATGDLARLDGDGRLWVIGRRGDVISVDGLKVFPHELEAVLRSHPAVADCAVVGLPDPVTWQRIGAAVVLRTPGVDADTRDRRVAELTAYAAERLARFKVPRSIAVVDALPRSTLGKLQRGRLAEQLLAVEAGVAPPAASRDPAVRAAYAAFAAAFDPAASSAYHARMSSVLDPAELGVTPMFLSRAQRDDVIALAGAVARLLRSPTLHATAWPRSGPFAGTTLPSTQPVFGALDLMLGPGGPRIVEINATTPGRVGLWSSVERTYHPLFGTRSLCPKVDVIEQVAAFVGAGGARVAVAVSHLPSSVHARPLYAAVLAELRRCGVDAEQVEARALRVGADGRPRTADAVYDRVWSLVVPFVWQRDPAAFAGLAAVLQQSPERVFPHPGTALLADKRLLIALGVLDRVAPELSTDDRARITAASLPAHAFAAFDGPEALAAAFGGSARLVVKPPADYGAAGVVMHPDPGRLAALFADEARGYIAHQSYRSDPIPWREPDGRWSTTVSELRVIFLGEEVVAMGAYADRGVRHHQPMIPTALAEP